MPQQLSDDAIAILQNLHYDGLAIRFQKVAPTLYRELNEVLIRLGGKWKGGRTNAHVFQEEPTLLIEYVLSTGLMPPKNPEAFFPTSKRGRARYHDVESYGFSSKAESKILSADIRSMQASTYRRKSATR